MHASGTLVGRHTQVHVRKNCRVTPRHYAWYMMSIFSTCVPACLVLKICQLQLRCESVAVRGKLPTAGFRPMIPLHSLRPDDEHHPNCIQCSCRQRSSGLMLKAQYTATSAALPCRSRLPEHLDVKAATAAAAVSSHTPTTSNTVLLPRQVKLQDF
jgi:hypothetical protein